MATPESQGGIDYQDGGFYTGQGGYPLVGDLAELAARLGSINTYDRRGSTIWQTDFEYGLQGTELESDHADSVGFLSTTRAYHGAYSLKLDPRGADNSYVYWSRVIQFLETGRVGGEIAISVDTDMDSIRLSLFRFDGSYELYGAIDYQEEDGLWKIRDHDLGWVTVLSGVVLQQGPKAWHSVKLVIDVENEEYVSLRASRYEVDLSDYSLRKSAASDLGQLFVRVQVAGSPTSHAPVYIDSVIITQSESALE